MSLINKVDLAIGSFLFATLFGCIGLVKVTYDYGRNHFILDNKEYSWFSNSHQDEMHIQGQTDDFTCVDTNKDGKVDYIAIRWNYGYRGGAQEKRYSPTEQQQTMFKKAKEYKNQMNLIQDRGF